MLENNNCPVFIRSFVIRPRTCYGVEVEKLIIIKALSKWCNVWLYVLDFRVYVDNNLVLKSF